MVNHYENNVASKPIIEPQKVLKYTQLYQNIADLYQNFMNDRIELTGNKRDKLTFTALYNEFKNWFQATRNVKTTVKASEFKVEMLQKIPAERIKAAFINGISIRAAELGENQFVDGNDAFNDTDSEDEANNNAPLNA